MSKYTIELYKLMENENTFELFDFNYELYNNELKEQFQKYFLDYFYFNEIGFETIGRFKKALQNKLNVIAPYYKEYYKTCIEVFTRDMMNTKEVTEEFVREVISNSENNMTSTNTSSTDNTYHNENIYSQTPKGQISSLEKYMTEGTIDNTNNNSETSNNGNTQSTTDGNLKETTSFTSKGNLGVSSDGFLIEKWREVIVDINYKICSEELSELFMLIY